MRKFTLLIASLFITIGAMAQETTPETLKLKFARTGTAVNTVTVNATNGAGEAIEGVNATLTGLTINGIGGSFMTTKGSSNKEDILTPDANATATPTIVMTFNVTGLPSSIEISQMDLDIHALNSSGNNQGNAEESNNRQWDVTSNINGTLIGKLDDIEIARGASKESYQGANATYEVTHKTWSITPAEALATNGSDVTITFTIEKGADNIGCYFGLAEIDLLYTESVEPTAATSYKLTQVTAEDLNGLTEATTIAIKNLAKNNTCWLDIKNEANSSNSAQYFSNDVVFVWEPVVNGESGKYYIKDLEGNYLQMYDGYTADYTKTDVKISLGTKDNAAVFHATNAIAGGSGSSNFNGDNGSANFIESNTDRNLVRFVTYRDDSNEGYWINTQQPTQQAVYNEGKGGFTIHYVYKLTEVEAFNVDLSANYATFCAPVNVVLPNEEDGVKAYYIDGTYKENTTDVLMLTEISGILPANAGIILYSETETEYSLSATSDDATATITNNKLVGVINDSFAQRTTGKSHYVLANNNGSVGFYGIENEIADKTIFKVKANKAYLEMPSTQASSVGFRFDFATTAIEEVETENGVEAVYDLQGRRINEITQPGIYVVGGVKVLVK